MLDDDRGQSLLKTEADNCMVCFLLTPEPVQIPPTKTIAFHASARVCYSARCPPHQGKAQKHIQQGEGGISFPLHQPYFNLSQNINIPISLTRFHQAMNLTTKSGWMPQKPCQKRHISY